MLDSIPFNNRIVKPFHVGKNALDGSGKSWILVFENFELGDLVD